MPLNVGDKVSVLLPFWMQSPTVGPYVEAIVIQTGSEHFQKSLVKYQGENGSQLDWFEMDRIQKIPTVTEEQKDSANLAFLGHKYEVRVINEGTDDEQLLIFKRQNVDGEWIRSSAAPVVIDQ